MRGRVIIVCGLIGSGKSTLSHELAEALGPSTLWLPEADDVDNRNPYLADYYADPMRWALPMQLKLLGLRFQQHQRSQWHALDTGYDVVLDSSYWQDTAFARLQHRLGTMDDRDFETYATLYRIMTASTLFPTAVVHILATPSTCQNRINKRMAERGGRACEKAVDLTYLQRLDEEIETVCNILRDAGTKVFDVPWDTERESETTRKQTVQGLAERIFALVPIDAFLAIHRRGL